jgi:hypothetical protein
VLLPCGGGVKSHVQRQYVHPRLAQQSQGSAFDMLVDKLTHTVLRYVTRFGNARHLEVGRLWRNVRIEPATGGGNQIDRDGGLEIFRLELVDVALDPLDQRLVVGPRFDPPELAAL